MQRKKLAMTCIGHCMRYLYIATMHTHEIYCMIHACSLYLYVVRFVTCQIVYLTHSWVYVFRYRDVEMELCGCPGAK